MICQMAPLNTMEIGFIALYLAFLLLIGVAGWRSRKANTLRDFYLGGSSTGLWVLLLTLYATQYSGNTLFGFTGKTYRVGFSWTVSIQFMTAIVVVYLTFAPRLFSLSRKQGFITPADYLQHRFKTPLLSLVASVVMILAIGNFLLAQMMAMGKAVEGLFETDPWWAYFCGVVFLAAIIVVYETLGGFRAVAWTDAIQGSILMVGFAALIMLIFQRFGSLDRATSLLAETDPSALSPPSAAGMREWISYLLIVGIGGALYPQAVQRIYCARNASTLRRSLMIMVFLPLVTTSVSLIAGIMGRAYLPHLSPDQTDSLLTIICREVQQQSVLGRWVVVVLFAAILAAIMSTADSLLLSISSMLTKDIYALWIRPGASEPELMRFGKWCAWLFITIAAVGAILLRGTTLVTLLDRKLDLLIQLGPAFILGLRWKPLKGHAVLLGLVTGVVIALTLAASGYGKLYNIHAGIYGLLGNLLVATSCSLLVSPTGTRAKEEELQNAGAKSHG
ncbi:MAG TPA: hypothetical protein DEF45_18895 [Rhodopirellula sp.]|nr:hypothetical protein [Rhodopirellula sp.]